jgi:phosphoribosylformylglycinamidine synthase subunit PurQ / glutaminase
LNNCSMERLKIGVVVFPGSNCDHDAYYVLKDIYRQEVKFLWHKNSDLENSDIIILPGGFSYGDYLRCGAIARFSPIMKEVLAFANAGGTVIGICNGFQTLCEAGLLPGALLRNANLSFACKYVNLRVETTNTKFTSECRPGEILRIPIAHGEGNYYADDKTLDLLEEHGQVLFRYCEPDGSFSESANPNGSSRNIAGITNIAGNVMGMMPHPERASDPVLRQTDGQKIFTSLMKSFLPAEILSGNPLVERN